MKHQCSAYSLACGAFERKHYGPVQITLWKEHGTYHVRAHDFENHQRRFWESFRTLKEARKHFDHAEALLVAGLAS